MDNPLVPTTQPQLNPQLPTNRQGELIFQLGSVQCFWFPTIEEIAGNMMPRSVYWRDSRYTHTFGPFPSIYNAMSHYAYLADLQKQGFLSLKTPDLSIDKPVCPVLMVDFRTKKRVQYDVPGGESESNNPIKPVK